MMPSSAHLDVDVNNIIHSRLNCTMVSWGNRTTPLNQIFRGRHAVRPRCGR